MYSDEDTLSGGLPHSEIPGSTIARISPGLFAACHVLHRLSVPACAHWTNAMTLSCPAFGTAMAKQVSLTQCVMRRQTLQADTLRPHVLGGANPRKFAGAFRLGHLQLASSQCPDQHALNHPWPDPMGPRKGLPTANSHLRQSAR